MSSSVRELSDFCNVQELLSILENWSQGTEIASVYISPEGKFLSKSYGKSPFCEYIHKTKEGAARCQSHWKNTEAGIHQCHSGFYDFSIPLILPDGTEIGKVLAGQVLSKEQSIDEIINKISGFVEDTSAVRLILEKTPQKSKCEMEGSYKLLKQMIEFFLQKSYLNYQEIEGRKFDVKMLTTALKTVYRISMFFNITKNTYHLIDYKTGVGMVVPQKGTIDEIVDIGVKSIPVKEQAEEYYKLFNRKALKKAYKEGKQELVLQHQQTIYNGEVHWMEGRLIFVNSNTDEINAVCLSRIIDKEIENELILNEALQNSKKQQKLLQEALDNFKQADYDRRRDFLTGLRNRQDMFDLFNDALSGKRTQIQSMFMMDIDNFKSLNDLYGHTYGDECLQKIGEALNEYGDLNNMYFYRYGGEEMLGVSFDNTKNDDQIAEELVHLVYNLKIERNDSKHGVVTISLGYTTDNSRYEKMIDKADMAMYIAKKNGKNQAVCFDKYKVDSNNCNFYRFP